jgi:hypothetical protein
MRWDLCFNKEASQKFSFYARFLWNTFTSKFNQWSITEKLKWTEKCQCNSVNEHLRLEMIRFGLVFVISRSNRCWFDFLPNRFRFDSIWSGLLLIWNLQKEYISRRWHAWLINIYICILRTQHARTQKKIFFVEFIELIRSISNSFEFCKSDENWAQLQALKLRQMLKLFATRQILMFLMFLLAYLFFLACKLARTSRTSKYWVANNFNICLNFKACNWAQFSSDLQNSNEFEMLRISSINFTKKKFCLAFAHAAYARCIYIYLLATHLNVFVYTLFLSIRTDFKSTRIKSNRNINDLIFKSLIQFDFESKTETKSNDLIETSCHVMWLLIILKVAEAVY